MSAAERAARVLAEWYADGEAQAPEEVLRAHPDLADELRPLFAARDVLGRAAAPPPAPPEPEIDGSGERRLGDFRIVSEIGRGGMGVVYEAEQVSLGRRVALKVLPRTFALSAKAVERFRREAQATGRLRHPHLVPVFAFGEQDGVWYYAMEWVRGRTLAEAIAARRRDGESESQDVRRLAGEFAGVADALAAAHAEGVIHRDVKPENLLLDADGTLRLMDFGLARVEGEGAPTLAGEMLGTPAYMSPEQARGEHERVDARTDVYALGATLYETLTLRPPFEDAEPHRLLARIAKTPPEPLRVIERSVPAELEAIVLKALEKQPDARYASAADMASDLRAFSEGRPVAARPRSPAGSLRDGLMRALRRRPALAALLVLAVLAGAVLALALPRPSEPAPSPWVARAPIPVGSYGLGAVFTDGRLYVVSGFHTPRVSSYDPRADAWRAEAPLPEALQYFGTAVIGRRIYVAGGDRGGAGVTDGLLAYDIDSRAWTELPPMPGGARWQVGAAGLDGRLYVVGGVAARTNVLLDRVEAFEPATASWTRRAPLPAACAVEGGIGVLDGRIVVAGGTDATRRVTSVVVYDPETDAWTPRAPLPIPMATQAAVVEGRLFLAAGGAEAGGRVFAYDPVRDAWTEHPPLTRPRRGHGVAYDPVGRRLYVVAGYDDAWLGLLESYDVRPK